jgi:hypothetical protein
LGLRSQSFSRDAVAIGEQPLEFPADEPISQEIPERTKRQFVINAVLKNAGARPFGRE